MIDYFKKITTEDGKGWYDSATAIWNIILPTRSGDKTDVEGDLLTGPLKSCSRPPRHITWDHLSDINSDKFYTPRPPLPSTTSPFKACHKVRRYLSPSGCVFMMYWPEIFSLLEVSGTELSIRLSISEPWRPPIVSFHNGWMGFGCQLFH